MTSIYDHLLKKHFQWQCPTLTIIQKYFSMIPPIVHFKERYTNFTITFAMFSPYLPYPTIEFALHIL